MTGAYPTADDVARAVVAACRETGADPEECVTGRVYCVGGAANKYALSRARVYAAFALDELFDECGSSSMSRMVGASSVTCHLSTARSQQRNGLLRWFDGAALERVKSAVRRPSAACRGLVEYNERRDEFDLPMHMRRAVATAVADVTASLMGDPPRERSALAGAAEWRPYEERAKYKDAVP